MDGLELGLSFIECYGSDEPYFGIDDPGFRSTWNLKHKGKNREDLIYRQLFPFELVEYIQFYKVIATGQNEGSIMFRNNNYDYNLKILQENNGCYEVLIKFKQSINGLPCDTKFKIVLDDTYNYITFMIYEPFYGLTQGGRFCKNICTDFYNLKFNSIIPISNPYLFTMLAYYFLFTITDRYLPNFYSDNLQITSDGHLCLISNDKKTLLKPYLNNGAAFAEYLYLANIIKTRNNIPDIEDEEDSFIENKVEQNEYEYDEIDIVYFRTNIPLGNSTLFIHNGNNKIKIMSILEYCNKKKIPYTERIGIQALFLGSVTDKWDDITTWDEKQLYNIIKSEMTKSERTYYEIPNFLYRDALDTISHNFPDTMLGWFNYLCAINLLLGYIKVDMQNRDILIDDISDNYLQNELSAYSSYYLSDDDISKIHLSEYIAVVFVEKIKEYLELTFGYDMDGFLTMELIKSKNILIISQEIETIRYHFLYIFSPHLIEYFEMQGVKEGDYHNDQLRTLAPILYKYSHCLLWKEQ